MKCGDLIAPGFASNYGSQRPVNFVYFTAKLKAATWGAEVAEWQEHAPGQLKQMHDHLADLKRRGIEAIEE